MTITLLTGIWPSYCTIREVVLSYGEGPLVKFKPMNSTQAYVFTEYTAFQSFTACLSKTLVRGIILR